MSVQTMPETELPPPSSSVGAVAWLRENLFSSFTNSVLTLFCIYVLYSTIVPFIDWAFLSSDWVGEDRTACTSGGACWVFVYVRFEQFMYGFYPETEYWRINTVGLLFVGIIGLLFSHWCRFKKQVLAFLLLGYPVVSFILLSGGSFGLQHVETSQWGGLSLTLILSAVGMVAALPLGILLALGRRSKMPIVKSLCTAYIELWRGVPLITVLFMASVMLPLFMPEGAHIDKLLRALIGIALFQSAYMAEVVRSGLQAIPKGQYEAADALGLSYFQGMRLIILPQALKLVIPGIVNTFIALFKDTSLVLIIGLFDLLAIVQTASSDPKWLGYSTEGYVFAGLVFWLFCFGMSRYSQSLERKLDTGHRN